MLLCAVHSHIQEGVSPALQGPLNRGSDSVVQHPQASEPVAVSMCSAVHLVFPKDISAAPTSATPASSLMSPMEGGAQQQDIHASPECTSAVVTAFSDGRVYAHVMQGLAAPAWLDATPQCILDAQGV